MVGDMYWWIYRPLPRSNRLAYSCKAVAGTTIFARGHHEHHEWATKYESTMTRYQRRRHDDGLVDYKPQISLSPAVKHTGQESGGQVCEIFKFWYFLQSKYMNNVCTPSASGRCPPDSSQIPYRGFALYPTGDFRPQTPASPNENSWRRHLCFVYKLTGWRKKRPELCVTIMAHTLYRKIYFCWFVKQCFLLLIYKFQWHH